MNFGNEIVEKHTKDLGRLRKAGPGKQYPMIIRWLGDKRESKGELAMWLLSQNGRVAHDMMMDIALNRRRSERLRVRALRVMKSTGIPLGLDRVMQFNIEASQAPRAVSNAIGEMLQASLKVSNDACKHQS